ncbi:MAG: hypothetical protein MUF49_10970 [Oculatellaceae cyanobacterium Prado106]|nr:hypothetical protein [Oculatellaceae cyanobacterium Prado106]
MLQPIQFLQTLTQRILSPNEPEEAEFWKYAEPAGEEPDPLKRNVLQWRRVISAVRNPLEEFPGQAVDVLGFVHRQPGDGDRQFTIARHIIRCCLADTVPLGLEKPTLVIVPSKLKPIREPQKVYINGVF